jgi:hypothetical protein
VGAQGRIVSARAQVRRQYRVEEAHSSGEKSKHATKETAQGDDEEEPNRCMQTAVEKGAISTARSGTGTWPINERDEEI